MADGDTQTQPPPDDILQQALAAAAQLQQSGPQPQPVRDTTPTTRSWPSLLGQALAGAPPLPGATDAEKEWMGRKALGDLGTSLMAQSGNLQGGTIFTALGRGLQAAQQGALGSEQFTAANLGAQQEYQQKQQEMRLAALKEALPLLTLAQKAAIAKNTPNLLTTPAPSTSIGAVGAGDGTYEGAIAAHEGTGANPNSTAMGGGQFLASTWGDFVKANPDLFTGMTPDQVLAARNNKAITDKAITWLAQENAKTLTAQNAPVSGQSLGIAHYLGAGTAAKIMGAPDNAPISGFVSEAAVRANPELATMTVGQMKARYAGVPNPGFLTPTKTAVAPPAATTAQTPPAPATAPPGVQIGGPPPAPPGSTAPATTYPQVGGGIGRVAAGTVGKAGPEQVTVAPPPVIKAAPVPAGKLLGQAEAPTPPPGSAAEALQAGVQLAQATPGIGTQVAGPPGVVTTPPAPPVVATAAPGVTIGDYNAPRPATTVPPPAPAPQATTQQPTDTRPDDQLTFNEYKARHGWQPSPEEQATFTLPQDQDAIARAHAAMATAAQNLQTARAGFGGDVDTAAKGYETASNNLATLQQKVTADNAARRQAWQTKQDTILDSQYQQARTLAAQKAIETQKGQQAIQLEQARGRTADESKVMQGLDETYETARGAGDQLDLARALSKSAGDPTFWQQVQASHPDLVRWAANLGALNPDQMTQLGYAGAMDAAMNKLISMARTGSGFQRMTNLDVQILSSQAPSGTEPEQWREAKMAYLQSYMARQMQYVDTVRTLRADGVPLYEAQKRAGQELGDMVPKIPTFADTPQKSAGDQRAQWAADNVAPNTFFRAPDGKLVIYRGPGATGGTQTAPPPPPTLQRPQVPVN